MKKLFLVMLSMLLIFAVSCGGEGNGVADTTKAPETTTAPLTSEPDDTPADTPAVTDTPDATTEAPNVTTEAPDATTEVPDATTEAPATSDGIAVGSNTDERPWGEPHFPA